MDLINSSEPKEDIFEDILRIEQHLNTNQNVLINGLQDTELKEAVLSIEAYISFALNFVVENDDLFQINQLKDNESGDISTKTQNSELYFEFLSLLSMDLKKMGMKSGRLIQLQKRISNKNRSTERGLEKTVDSTSHSAKHPPKVNSEKNARELNAGGYRHIITLKSMAVLKISGKAGLFKIKKTKEMESYVVRLMKKPSNWSMNDYDELTVPDDICITTRLYNYELSYLKRQCENCYLNTKTLLDRICKHFLLASKAWHPSQDNSSHVNKYKIEIESCNVHDNQIKIVFSWKGIKFKDLEFHVYIQIGLRFYEEENTVHTFLMPLLDSFLRSGKFAKALPTDFIIDSVIRPILLLIKSHFKLDLITQYLTSNVGIKYWSLNLIPIKLNFLKFLCYLSGLSSNSLVMERFLFILNNKHTEQNASSVDNQTKRINTAAVSYNHLLNDSNYFFVIIKNIQSLLYYSLNKDLSEKYFLNGIHDEDILIPELFFNEILRCNRIDSWQPSSCFDRIWSILSDLHQIISNKILTFMQKNESTSDELLHTALEAHSMGIKYFKDFLSAVEFVMKYLLDSVQSDEKKFNLQLNIPTEDED